MAEPLKKNFSHLPFVTVVDATESDTEGTATFNQLRHPASSSLLKSRLRITKEFEADSWDLVGTVEVRKISYDKMVADEKEISILKLDIQGAEMAMLRNSQTGLSNK